MLVFCNQTNSFCTGVFAQGLFLIHNKKCFPNVSMTLYWTVRVLQVGHKWAFCYEAPWWLHFAVSLKWSFKELQLRAPNVFDFCKPWGCCLPLPFSLSENDPWTIVPDFSLTLTIISSSNFGYTHERQQGNGENG